MRESVCSAVTVSSRSGAIGANINVVQQVRRGAPLRVDDLDRREDKCIGINGVGHTVPQGVTNVQLQLQKSQWDLQARNGRDQWLFSQCAYPVSR